MSSCRSSAMSVATESRRASAWAASIGWPAGSRCSWAWPTASSTSVTRAPAAASTLRSSACAQTAPNIPVLAPITATGLLRSGFDTSGREAQSTAFFSTPGIDELYSGVANRTASASAIARLRATTGAGRLPSSSSSYGGIALRASKSSNWPPWRSTISPAARSSFVLWESRRRLPLMPSTRIRSLDKLQVDDDRDLVGQRGVAARERVVPVEPEAGAVDLGLELEPEALAAVGVGSRIVDVTDDLDRLGVALQRQLAGHREVVAGAADLARLEAQLREALRVEELGALQVRRQVRVLHLDAADLRCPAQRSVSQASAELRERALKASGHVGNPKSDRRVGD